jgi:hypothetical protein
MASIVSMFRKTLKRGTKIASNIGRRSENIVRRVGKVSRKTARRATNTLGLTRRKHRKSHRKSHRRAH